MTMMMCPRWYRLPAARLRGVARSTVTCLLPAWIAAAGWCLPRSAGATEHAFRVAFSPTFFGEAGRGDASAAVLAWQRTILEPDGIPFNPEPLVCSDLSELIQALRRGEVDAVALEFTEFASMPADLLETDTVYINERHGGPFDRYVLLAAAGAGIEQIEQLKGKKVILWDHQRSCLLPTWLDQVLDERKLGPAPRFFADITKETKPAKVVLPVFFGQADAALITASSFEDMCELNPQVGKKLHVIATSPELVASFLCFRRGYDSPYRPRVELAIQSLHKSAAGRQILTIFGCDEIAASPGTFLQSARDLWERRGPTPGPGPGSIASDDHAESGDRP